MPPPATPSSPAAANANAIGPSCAPPAASRSSSRFRPSWRSTTNRPSCTTRTNAAPKPAAARTSWSTPAPSSTATPPTSPAPGPATDADPTFRALVAGVNALERRLVAMVRPGPALRRDPRRGPPPGRRAARRARRASRYRPRRPWTKRLTRAFFPHGVGHQLGLQVHDVAGHQATPEGGTPGAAGRARSAQHPHPRGRPPGHHRAGRLFHPHAARTAARRRPRRRLRLALIDRLLPLGGVRIEDDVVCTADGYEDLTRQHIEV